MTVLRETDEISKLQSKDDELHLIRQYLKDGTLPSDEKRARKIFLQKDQLDKCEYCFPPGCGLCYNCRWLSVQMLFQ